MNYKVEEIKSGVKVHHINTNKFKTNLFSIFITTPLTRDSVTKNAMLAAVLRRGTQNLHSQEEISKSLEELYGASFDCGVEKTGDNHVMKFYLECVNDEFLPNDEKVTLKALNMLMDIVFNPVLNNEHFLQEYVEGEKENVKQLIQSKIDNKDRYAVERCIEEMYKNEPYGLYKFGYIEDLEKIDAKNLYNYYKSLISKAKIDIYISGDIKEDIIEEIKSNKNIITIPEHVPVYNSNNDKSKKSDVSETEPNIINESMQVSQGKLIIGLNAYNANKELKFATSVYNVILGGSANSKLFQNVREKASLAYTCNSTYLRAKDSIFIKSGIEIENYDKTIQIINEQLDQMKYGDFRQEDIDNATKLIISTVNGISDSQDSEITYYFAQEISDTFIWIDEYIAGIKSVNKEKIQQVANQVKIDTIYFLRD